MLIPFGVFSAAGAGGGGGGAGSYELISTTVLGSSQASIDFDVSTYASTYKHLQIRFAVRGARVSGSDDLRMRFNGSTSTYSVHYLYGTGSNVYAASDPFGSMYLGTHPASTDTANAFGVGVVDILDPFSSTKSKTIRALNGRASSSYTVMMVSGAYLSTTAVSAISIYGQNANLATGTRISIYGIKGA